MNFPMVDRFVMLFLLLTVPQQPHLARKVTNQTVVKVPNGNGLLLDQILKVAGYNRIPLGIVLESNNLCESKLHIDKPATQPLGSWLQDIQGKISGYKIGIDHGTVFLRPDSPSKAVNGFLGTKIAFFKPESTTMEGLNQYLWMYIRAAINPKEGSVLSIISNPDSPVISGFSTNNPQTVLTILNLVVQQGPGGAWLMIRVPEDWEKSLKRNPVIIAGYPGAGQSFVDKGCSAVTQFLNMK